MYIYIYVGMCVLLAAWSAYAIAEAPMARRSSIGRGDTARAVANRRSRVCTSTHAVDSRRWARCESVRAIARARACARAHAVAQPRRSGAGAADGAGGFKPRECAQPTPTRSDPIRSVPTRLDSTRSLVGAGGFCLFGFGFGFGFGAENANRISDAHLSHRTAQYRRGLTGTLRAATAYRRVPSIPPWLPSAGTASQ